MAKKIKEQIVEALEDSKVRLEELKERGLKVATEAATKGRDVAIQVKETVTHEAARGQEMLGRLQAEDTLKDLMDRFGSLKLSEAIQKMKESDIIRQTGNLRNDLLASLQIPTQESVTQLQAAIDKLAKEVAELKTLRRDVSRLSQAAKPAKKAAEPKATAEPKAAAKSAPKAAAAPKAATKTAKKATAKSTPKATKAAKE
ncbi:MAG TPA: hypothetical protein PLC97_00180 [Myxococcota bacterium]|nr:hypothetical protein [Myxococcota bacterium]